MPLSEQDPFPITADDSALLRFLAEAAEFGIVHADQNCVIRYGNAAAMRYFGGEGSLIGESCCRLLSLPDHACFGCPVGTVRAGGRPSGREITLSGAEEVIVHLQPYPAPTGESGLFLVARDVTADRRTERILREEVAGARRCRERLENILRAVGEGLVVADRQGQILLLNRPAEKFLGIRQTSLLHLSLADCIHDRKLLKRLLRAIEHGRSGHFEVRGEAGAVWSVHVSPLQDADGSPGDTVFLLRDITHERELDRLKSEFISTAAHELRTPLTAITGFSELILTDPETPDTICEYATYIHRKAESLERIISDLLDTSRIEAGRGIDLNRESCDLVALIRETVLPYRCRNTRHKVEIDLPAGPLEMRLDRGKMVQVLENLLSNAIKYSPQGGNLRVSLCLLPGACQIAVEDQGIGMTQDEAARAFERFWRGDSSNTAVSGTGLGLSIAKYIVEAHCGRIWLESRKNKGTTVFLNLPLPPAGEGRPAGSGENDQPCPSPISAGDLFSRPEPLQGSAGLSAP